MVRAARAIAAGAGAGHRAGHGGVLVPHRRGEETDELAEAGTALRGDGAGDGAHGGESPVGVAGRESGFDRTAQFLENGIRHWSPADALTPRGMAGGR